MPGIDKNTLLMLHGNEFVDVSPMKKKITNQGATISEETHFQGQKSFYFDGSTKVVQVEPPAYDFGAGNFTIDWWENCTTGVRFSTNYSLEEGGILLGYDGKALYIGEPGKWEIFYNQTAFNVTPGQWVHWAFVRNGSTFTSYRNGKRFWSGTSDKRIYFDATDIWSIGNYRPDGISAFKGYIQEFRVSNIARWTSDFTPPTSPYSPDISTPSIFAPSSAIAGGQFVIRWSAVENAANYTLEQQVDGGAWGQVYTGAGTNYQATASGSAMGFRVLAADADGNESEYATSGNVKIFPNLSGKLFGGVITNG